MQPPERGEADGAPIEMREGRGEGTAFKIAKLIE